jgi:glutamine cyclotransferase
MVLLAQCGSKSTSDPTDKPGTDSPRIKKATQLVSPAIRQEVKPGESIRIEVKTDKEIDSMRVVGEESQTFYSSQVPEWFIPTTGVGAYKFRVQVYYEGQMETHYPTVVVLSDIEPEEMSYLVTGIYSHDTDAYTQGLVYYEDFFYESTGQKGASAIRKVEPITGDVIKQIPLEDRFFGEGCTIYKDRLYQLTWQSQVGIIYDLSLNEIKRFQYNTEGWGLTTVGDSLAMTDGSEYVYFMNPEDFTEMGRIQVYNHEGPIKNLNELEYINGYLYANEYLSDNIHVIEVASGKVLQTIDMAGLLTEEEAKDADVLNGIAYDVAGDRLFVTGKWWPWIYEIKLQPKSQNNPT